MGLQSVEVADSTAIEFQSEYRAPFGLGLGGGFVEKYSSAVDTIFGKVSYRNKLSYFNYILEMQVQDVAGRTSGGGYVAFYDEQLMLASGYDGEQWRTCLGYIAPVRETRFRPALEVLYVDNSIGEQDGPKILFANATLKFSGGFLSHKARLGRAMGPTGLEFGNPLAFLFPTWNRRLDLWELGGLGNFRLERRELPDGSTTERYEALAFPFQFDESENVLDYLFVGGFHSRTPAEDSPGIIAGLTGKLGFLHVSAGFEYDIDTDETRAVVGIIDRF